MTLSRLWLPALVGTLWLGASASAAAARPKLVVMDLVAERGIDESTVRLLNELLLTKIMSTGRYEVLGSSDVKAILTGESQRNMIAGCDDVSCLAELGGALGADFLAISNIGKIGDYYLFNLKLIDVKKARVVQRWSQQVEGMENRLLGAVRKGVDETVGKGSPAEAPAALPKVVVASEVAGSGAADTTAAEVEAEGSRPALGKPGPVSIGLWSAGVVGLVAGVVFGLQAKAHYANATDPTYQGSQLEVSSGETSQMWANVGFGIGAVGVIAGTATWFFWEGRREAPVALVPVMGSDGAGLALTGRF